MAAQEQKTLKIDVKTPAGKVDGAIELPTGRRSPPPTRTTGYGTGAPTGSAGGHILAMRTHGSRSRDGVTT